MVYILSSKLKFKKSGLIPSSSRRRAIAQAIKLKKKSEYERTNWFLVIIIEEGRFGKYI